jgi:hypothetical protein
MTGIPLCLALILRANQGSKVLRALQTRRVRVVAGGFLVTVPAVLLCSTKQPRVDHEPARGDLVRHDWGVCDWAHYPAPLHRLRAAPSCHCVCVCVSVFVGVCVDGHKVRICGGRTVSPVCGYLRECVRACMRAYVRVCMRACVCVCVRACVCVVVMIKCGHAGAGSRDRRARDKERRSGAYLARVGGPARRKRRAATTVLTVEPGRRADWAEIHARGGRPGGRWRGAMEIGAHYARPSLWRAAPGCSW